MRHFISILSITTLLYYPGLQGNEGVSQESVKISKEISKEIGKNQEIAKVLNWSTLAQKIEKTITTNRTPPDRVPSLFNIAVQSKGLYHPVIVSNGDLLAYQMGHLEKATSGIVSERKGKYSYIKYVLPGSPADKLGLERGDRLSSHIPLVGRVGQTVEIKVKASPLEEEKSIRFSFEKITSPLVTQMASNSQMRFQLTSKATVDYIHLLDCSKAYLPILKNHLSRALSYNSSGIILDLRDSYCESETEALHEMLSENLKQTSFYILANNGTRQGAERLIQTLRNRRKVTVMGTRTGRFWHPTKLVPLSNISQSLILPSAQLVLKPGIKPDFLIEDRFIFSEGQDDLVNQALRIIKGAQNS